MTKRYLPALQLPAANKLACWACVRRWLRFAAAGAIGDAGATATTGRPSLQGHGCPAKQPWPCAPWPRWRILHCSDERNDLPVDLTVFDRWQRSGAPRRFRPTGRNGQQSPIELAYSLLCPPGLQVRVFLERDCANACGRPSSQAFARVASLLQVLRPSELRRSDCDRWRLRVPPWQASSVHSPRTRRLENDRRYWPTLRQKLGR